LWSGFFMKIGFGFQSGGVPPFAFSLRLNGTRLAIAPYNQQGASAAPLSSNKAFRCWAQERHFPKFSPDLLEAVVEAIRAVAIKYGATVAVEFAYEYILGRRADPTGLADKNRLLCEYKLSVEDICAQMLASEEYQARGVLLLRDPFAVIKSWAEIENG
jgi:hypothetical protein